MYVVGGGEGYGGGGELASKHGSVSWGFGSDADVQWSCCRNGLFVLRDKPSSRLLLCWVRIRCFLSRTQLWPHCLPPSLPLYATLLSSPTYISCLDIIFPSFPVSLAHVLFSSLSLSTVWLSDCFLFSASLSPPSLAPLHLSPSSPCLWLLEAFSQLLIRIAWCKERPHTPARHLASQSQVKWPSITRSIRGLTALRRAFRGSVLSAVPRITSGSFCCPSSQVQRLRI